MLKLMLLHQLNLLHYHLGVYGYIIMAIINLDYRFSYLYRYRSSLMGAYLSMCFNVLIHNLVKLEDDVNDYTHVDQQQFLKA